MDPKMIKNGSHFWSPFGAFLGPKMDPKMAPKLVQNLVNLGFIFGCLFCWVLKLFGCLFRAFLGLPRLSREASGPQKPSKTEGFFRFLQMQLFWSLRLLMTLLGSSCPLLGPIWPQNDPQNGSKSGPKTVQKVNPKRDPKRTPK